MDFDLIFLISFLAVGILCLYTALRLRREDKLFDNIVLYPGGLKKEDCLDPKGFLAYMRPRMTILGGGCTLVGLAYLLRINGLMPKAGAVVHTVVTIAVLAWGFWIYARAGKRFW